MLRGLRFFQGTLQSVGDSLIFGTTEGSKVSVVGVDESGNESVLKSTSADTNTSSEKVELKKYDTSDTSVVSSNVRVNPSLPDVTVKSLNSEGTLIESVKTDSSGDFSVKAQDSGQLFLSVEGSTAATGSSDISNTFYSSKKISVSDVKESSEIVFDTDSGVVQTVTYNGSTIDVLFEQGSDGSYFVGNPWQAVAASKDTSGRSYKLISDINLKRSGFTQTVPTNEIKDSVDTNSFSITSSTQTVSITWLDIGLGDSVLVESSSGETILVDTGDFRDDGSKVISELESRGISEVDHLVATHMDADHIGGHAEIINSSSIDVGSVYDSGETATTTVYTDYVDAVNNNSDLSIETLSTGDTIPFEGATVSILHPNSVSSNSNNSSLVLNIQHEGRSYMLPGDIESEAESDIVSRGSSQLESYLLHVPHNGSSTSSTDTFVNSVNPEYAVITSNLNNQFGHPEQSVIDTYESNNVGLYWTALNGNITLTSTDTGATISTEKGSVNDATKPANFDVTIDSIPTQVSEGDVVSVDYTVENTGERVEKQDITLSVNSSDEDENSDLELSAGGSTSGTLDWDTSGFANGDYTVTLSSDDETITKTVQVGTTSGSNVVLNPSFETGTDTDATDWTETTTAGSGRTNAQATNGSYSVVMNDLTGSYGGRTLSSTKVSVQSNESYNFQAKYYLEQESATTLSNYRHSMEVIWYNSSGTEIDNNNNYSDFSAFNTWTPVSYSVTAPSDASQAKVVIEAKEDVNEDVDVYWDTIELVGP